MVCQSLHICKLPIIVLWRVFAFLDDDSLLIFLSTCYHIFDAADKDDSTWESWFRRRYGKSIDTKTWIKWHDQVLATSDSLANKHHSNYRWIRHCIGRLCLEKNWRRGKYSPKLFSIPSVYYFGSDRPSPQIISHNIWGTLVVIANKYFHYLSHGSEHRSFSLGYPVFYTFYDEIELITGLSNDRFIVISMLFKNAKFGEKHQNIFYWKVDELTSEQQAPYTINHLDMTVQLNSLHGDWLLLQAPPPIHRTHSAYIVNLAHSTPIPVKTAPSWNTYTIVETNKRQCTIYTGCLHQHSQSDSTLYSWDILRASLIDVRSSSVRGYISLPLRVDKQGERHSRLLTSDIAMVWQAPQKNVKKQTSDAQTWRELCQQRQSSSVFDGNRRNNSVTSVKVENIFFIHNINTSSIYYSGKFIGDTPNVSFCKKQIIILNGSNLKLVNLTSKQTVFETTVANSLIHLGFVLDNYWVAQHPGGGFFTMSMDAQPQIGWIPTDERKGATVVNHAAIVKLSSDGRRLLIWNMHRN